MMKQFLENDVLSIFNGKWSEKLGCNDNNNIDNNNISNDNDTHFNCWNSGNKHFEEKIYFQ